MDWLREPFDYAFMRTALAGSVIVGITCAVLGVYVVLRRMAFAGEALSHTILPGLVVAYLNGWSLFGGAFAAGVLTALLIGWLSRREALREDAAIGVVFTGMLALGVFLMSRASSFRDLSHILFGNVLGVTGEDLILIAAVAVVVLGLLFILHKEFELTSFDPTHAGVIGLPADRLRYLLLLLLALTVVAGVQAVGVILITALLVTPAAAASLLTVRLPAMMLLAAAIAVLSAVAGLYASYYYDVSSGSAIVLACTVCFAAAWAAHAARTGRFA